MSAKNIDKLIIWDHTFAPQSTFLENSGQLFLYTTALQPPKSLTSLSLCAFVDSSATQIRNIYFEWLDLLSRSPISTVSLAESLRIDQTYTLWWSSLLYESSNTKRSPYINEILEIIAITLLISEYPSIKSVSYFGKRTLFSRSLSSLCYSRSLSYTSSVKYYLIFGTQFSIFYQLLSSSYAFTWFTVRTLARIPSLLLNFPKSNNKTKILFFSYLVGLQTSEHDIQAPVDKYWSDLPSFIQSKASYTAKTVYFHFISPGLKNIYSAMNIVKQLRLHHPSSSDLFDSYFHLGLYFSSLLTWIQKILLPAWKFQIPLLQGADISHFVRKDLITSLVGRTCLLNIYYYLTIKRILRLHPNLRSVSYPYEGQDWEYALLSLCKQFNIKTIAYQHASVRYWDLRNYLPLPRPEASQLSAPLPELIATTSPIARKNIIEYYKSHIPTYRVEPLKSGFKFTGCLTNSKPKSLAFSPKRILIVGEFDRTLTIELISLLTSTKTLSTNHFTLKPHPASSYDYEVLANNPNFDIRTDSIVSLKPEIDAAVVSANSTAVYDLLLLKIPVFTFLNSSINLSPLYKTGYSYYFSDASQLYSLLSSLESYTFPNSQSIINPASQDEEYPLWQEILG